MNPNGVRKPEQIKLIMECRQSELSDYQWCQKQDINPGTFYNWVSKLRKAGYTIPDSESKVSRVPVSVLEVCHMLGDISGAANIYIITGYTDNIYVVGYRNIA